jgi:hypothetical protein
MSTPLIFKLSLFGLFCPNGINLKIEGVYRRALTSCLHQVVQIVTIIAVDLDKWTYGKCGKLK